MVRHLAETKVLTSPLTRDKLKKELEARRRAALALIEDEKAYPYPSETHVGQAEVDSMVERVREMLAHRQPTAVRRYVLPRLQALNFVIDGVLDGGVNRSLNLDGHGKSLSFRILELEILAPPGLIEP